MGVGFGTDEDRRRIHDDDHGRIRCTDRDHGIEAAMAAAAVVTQLVIMRLFLLWRLRGLSQSRCAQSTLSNLGQAGCRRFEIKYTDRENRA